MGILTDPIDISKKANFIKGLYISTQKFSMIPKKRKTLPRKISTPNKNPLKTAYLDFANPREISSKKFTVNPINMEDPRFKKAQQQQLRPFAFTQDGSPKSPKHSGSGYPSPIEISPHFILPKEILEKYQSYIEEIAVETLEIDLIKYNEAKNPKKADADLQAFLKESLYAIEYFKNCPDTPSNSIEIYANVYCQRAIWTAFMESKISYSQYQQLNVDDKFVAALFKNMQNNGVLLKNAFPSLQNLNNILVKYLNLNQEKTFFIEELYSYVHQLCTIDKFSSDGMPGSQGKELNAFLSIFDVLNPEKSERKKSLSPHSSPLSSRSKGLVPMTNPIAEIMLIAIGGSKLEGQRVLETLRSYAGKRGANSLFEDLKLYCNEIAALCHKESRLSLRENRCLVDHYLTEEHKKPGLRLRSSSQSQEIYSDSMSLLESPKRMARTTKILNTFKLSHESSSTSSLSAESPRTEGLLKGSRLSLTDSEGSVGQRLHPSFLKTHSFGLNYNIDIEGKPIYLTSYGANSVEDTYRSFKLKSLPSMIAINGTIFYSKSISPTPLSKELKSSSQHYKKNPSFTAKMKSYNSQQDFLEDFFVSLHIAGLNKNDNKSTEDLSSGKMTFGNFIKKQEIKEEAEKLIRYGNNPDELRSLGNQFPFPILSKMIPALKITELMSDHCVLQAVCYMSLLYPQFFSENENSEYSIRFDMGTLKESLEHHIEIIDSNKYKVWQINKFKIFHASNKEKAVANLLYTYTSCPSGRNSLKGFQPYKGWESALVIEDCKMIDWDHWAFVLSILTNPKVFKSHKDLLGVEFNTSFLQS